MERGDMQYDIIRSTEHIYSVKAHRTVPHIENIPSETSTTLALSRLAVALEPIHPQKNSSVRKAR